VLTQSDLPSGYQYESGSPRASASAVAKYPSVTGSVDKCVLNPSVTFTGGRPRAETLQFAGTADAGGSESVSTFPSARAAKSYFTRFERAFARLPDCTAVRIDHDSSSATPAEQLGTYDALDVGKVGDERMGVVLDPAAPDPNARAAVFRDGNVVVLVQIADPAMSDAEFRTLLERADKRAA